MKTIYVVYKIRTADNTPFIISSFDDFGKAEEAVKFLKFINPDDEYLLDASPLFVSCE